MLRWQLLRAEHDVWKGADASKVSHKTSDMQHGDVVANCAVHLQYRRPDTQPCTASQIS